MTCLMGIGVLGAAWLASLSMVACGGRIEAERLTSAAVGPIEMGIDSATGGNTASTLGTLESCARVDVPSPAFDDVSDYNIDVYVKGDTQAPIGYDAALTYDQNLVHIAAPGTDTLVKMPGAIEPTGESLPDRDGTFIAGAAYFTGQGIAGDGTLVRIGLDIGGSGLVTFTLGPPPSSAYASNAGVHTLTLVSAQLAINQACQAPTPTPFATPTPISTSTPGTAIPGTPTATPRPGTIMLVSGWNGVCYVGSPQPIDDALADIRDGIQAVYRLTAGQGFQRWFPGRPELSTLATVGPYQALLVLMSDAASWSQELVGAPPSTVALLQGWNSVCYAGQAKSAEDATAGVAGGLSIMYQLTNHQVWSRYVPGRPDASNIVQLSPYDVVLMLVNQEGGATWTFDP